MATPTNLPAAQTTGNVLTAAYVNDLRGAFRILQVVNATTTTSATNTTGTFADTNLTATMTCQSNTSKVLILVGQSCFGGAGLEFNIRLLAGATTLVTNNAAVLNSAGSFYQDSSIFHLHSPASTSAITYKTQFARGGAAGTAAVQLNGQTSSIVLLEISA